MIGYFILKNILIWIFPLFAFATNAVGIKSGPAVGKITENSAQLAVEFDRTIPCRLEWWTSGSTKRNRKDLGSRKLFVYSFQNLKPNSTFFYQVLCRPSVMGYVGGQFTTEQLFLPAPLNFVSPPKITEITATTASIAWETSTFAGGRIRYGTKILSQSEDVEPLKKQILRLEGLQPNQTYQYQVELFADTERLTSKVQTFRTKPGKISPAAIFQLPPTVTSISGSKAVIQFETTRPTRATLMFGVSSKMDQKKPSKLLTRYHTVNLDHLKPNATYYFKVKVSDEKGISVLSDPNIFTTNLIP